MIAGVAIGGAISESKRLGSVMEAPLPAKQSPKHDAGNPNHIALLRCVSVSEPSRHGTGAHVPSVCVALQQRWRCLIN
jgi:hypothetical protein